MNNYSIKSDLISAIRSTKLSRRSARDLNAVMQRASRPPGAGLERAALDMPMSFGQQLAENIDYQAFAKDLKRSSLFACNLRMPPNRKATVSGISPTEYMPQRLWGSA